MNSITDSPQEVVTEQAPVNPHQEVIVGLERLIAFLKEHPDKVHGIGPIGCNVFFCDRAELLEAVRGCGYLEKKPMGDYFGFRKNFSEEVWVDWYTTREKICTEIVTQRVAPAEPERIIPAKPERIVEDVTWDCPESLLAEVQAP